MKTITLLIRGQMLLLFLGLTAFTPGLFAKYVGGQKCICCIPCGDDYCYDSEGSQNPCISYDGPGAIIGLTEGNLQEPIPALGSSIARTLDFRLTYNSYNADGSQAQIDSVAGYGWTHTYNSFLFAQVGSMFLMGPNGRTEKFQLGAGGAYTADTGYFNTLVKNPDGSFTMTTKRRTVYRFALVAGTPFMVFGPV